MAQPTMSTDPIRDAIRNHTCLTAVYDNYVRYFCPYALGRTPDGVPAVVAFQYEGGAKGGMVTRGEWRLFLLHMLRDVRPNNDNWQCDPPRDPVLAKLQNVEISAPP
jgi:hypothetical protein